MDILQILEALNTPEILARLAEQLNDALPVDGLNAVGNNPLLPDRPVSKFPTI